MATKTAQKAKDVERGRQELKEEFIQLRAKGYSYAKIARRLRVAKGTLANWNAELEGEIARLKAMELEALQEQYFLLKEGRIKLLGDQIKAIRRELKSRDLSEVPTEKLMEMLLRYYGQMKEEYVEARPLSDEEVELFKV